MAGRLTWYRYIDASGASVRRGFMLTKRTAVMRLIVLVFVSLVSFAVSLSVSQSPAEWKPVEAALGRSGKVQSDGTFKFGMPRKDLKVTAGNVRIKPGPALGSWAAFSSSGNGGMVMGDPVLTGDEVPAVMGKLQQGSID